MHTEQEQVELEFLRDRYGRLVRIVSQEWLDSQEGRGWGGTSIPNL